MEILNDLKEQILSYYDQIIALLPKLGIGIVICGLLLMLIRLIRRRTIKVIRSKAEDQLLISFINNVFRIANVVIVILLFMYIIGLSKVAGSILGAAGVSAFIIGFAFKDIGENFLAGVFMAFKRPFRLGDTIKTEAVEGVIQEMSLRDTHIKTFDGKDVYVPNGQIIKNPLYNYTIDGFLRANFSVKVAYGVDLDVTRKFILEEVQSTPGILQDEKQPRTHVKLLDSSAIEIEVHYWVDTFNKSFSGLEIKSIAQQKIVSRLRKENIKIQSEIIEVVQ